MFDPQLRRLIDPVIDRIAARVVALGLSADQVTWIGFGFGVGACVALALGENGIALTLFLSNRFADGLDGAVARAGATGGSDYGGYLDIVLDFMVYSGLVMAFAIGRPETALWAAWLIFSFVATGSGFLAFGIIAAKRGIDPATRGPKAFFYVGGIAEGGETIFFLALMCAFPAVFPWIVGIFSAMCWMTVLARIATARAVFRNDPS